jgi:hypothetical protein
MKLAAACRWNRIRDRRRKQWVRETKSYAVELEHACRYRRVEPGWVVNEREHSLDARVAEQRNHWQHGRRLRRQLTQPFRHQSADRVGNETSVCGDPEDPATLQRTRNLERYEWIAARLRLDPSQRRSRERRPQACSKQAMKSSDAEAADMNDIQLEARSVQLERNLWPGLGALRAEKADAFIFQPAKSEPQGLDRRVVEPLDIIDRHEHRRLLGKQTNDISKGRGYSVKLRPPFRCFFDQEGDCNCLPLGGRQLIEHLGEPPLEQVAQPRERQRSFALRRPCLEHRQPTVSCSPNGLREQACLAHPGLTDEHHPTWPFRQLVDKSRKHGLLVLAPEDFLEHVLQRIQICATLVVAQIGKTKVAFSSNPRRPEAKTR